MNKNNESVRGTRFQEKSTYTESVKGFDCPHCGAYLADKKLDNNTTIQCEVNLDNYETPLDVKFMSEHHDSHSWTEDCKCANCGKMLSRSNGC